MRTRKAGFTIPSTHGELDILFQEPESLQAAQYANYQIVHHSRSSFTIYFLQLDPLSVDTEQKTIEAILVSKVVLAPSVFASLIGAMQANYNQYWAGEGQASSKTSAEEA